MFNISIIIGNNKKMHDKQSQQSRSLNMAKVHSKNTIPEIKIRKALFNKGFRYRIHDKSLPGNPDIILPKYKAVIQINGCFWHGHNCYLFSWPKTNPEFWQTKISGNQKRDKKNNIELEKSGWRVLIIWGCALKGKNKISFDILIEQIITWLISYENSKEITHEIDDK